MSTHKYIDRICVAVIAVSLLLTILFMNASSFGVETMVDEDAETYTGSVYFTANDRNGVWDASDATTILLDGTDGKISGSGAYFYDGDLVIASGGSYVVSGELTEGSIVVDAYQSSKVWILLDGVNITCADDACIRVDQADKVFLTLAEGSENVLESGSEYSGRALEDGTDGAIFSHDDLTINGSGSLTVTAGYKHGIVSNDDLVITGGTVTVNAAVDGIRGKDSVRITDAQIQVTAGDDAVHSDTEVDIFGGTILIDQCYEGIEAPQISISGGDITIYPTDDGLNASGESEPCIRISGGTITIINESARDADGIDSNGDIIISGGTVRISLSNTGGNNAIDYGSENGGTCEINGGTVIACGSSSMAEEISPASSQCSILFLLDEEAAEGTTVSLQDGEGNVLLQEEIPCSFSSVILSCPQLQLNETYEVTAGEMSEEAVLEEVATSLGSVVNAMFLGGGMMGGRPEMRDMAEMGERPEMGDMPEMGERPEMGDMPEMGEHPEMGDMPEMENMSEMGQRPDMENMSEMGQEAQTNSNQVSVTELDKSTWIWLGASAAVLVLGTCLAAGYRRRR